MCTLNEVWGMNPRDSRPSPDNVSHQKSPLNEVWGMNPRDSIDTCAERLTMGPAQRSLEHEPQRQP